MSAVIAVVIDHMNLYQAQLISGIREGLKAHSIPLLVCSGDPTAEAVPPVLSDLIPSRQVLGVLATQLANRKADAELFDLLAGPGAPPTVFLGQHKPGFASVVVDNSSGIADVMRHLLDDQGIQRVVLVRGIAHQSDCMARERAVYDELARRDLPLDPDFVIKGEFNRDSSYRAMADLLHRRRDFDGVVAMNDQSALGAMEAVLDAGLQVPQDVAIVGFDNDESIRAVRPLLSTVDQDLQGQGRAAVDLLMRILDGADLATTLVHPIQILVHESSQQLDAAMNVHHTLSLIKDGTEHLRAQLSILDATVSMNRALLSCRTVKDGLIR